MVLVLRLGILNFLTVLFLVKVSDAFRTFVFRDGEEQRADSARCSGIIIFWLLFLVLKKIIKLASLLDIYFDRKLS